MDTARRSFETEVLKMENGDYRAIARLTDPFHTIEVMLLINAIDFSIVDASAEMMCCPYGDKCPDSLQSMGTLSGLRIGPGLNQAIREAVGGGCGCAYLVELVTQACKFTIVVAKSEEAREAILIQNNIEKFSEIQEQMGRCAGHRNLPRGRLPDWLEHERKKVDG